MKASIPAETLPESPELTPFLSTALFLHDGITLENTESASPHILGYASSDCTHQAANDTGQDICLQQVETNDGDLSAIVDVPWNPLDLVYESPRTIWGLEGLDNSGLVPSSLEVPSPLLSGSWILDSEDLQAQSRGGHSRVVEPTTCAKESSIWSCGSVCSTSPTEPASPSFLPSVASISTLDGRRQYSSIRSSRNINQSLHPTSDKRQINSIQRSKSFVKGTRDSFSCETCGRSFRYKKDLERHKHSVHNSKPSWFCPAEGCKFAMQGFSRKDKAFQHVKTHQRHSDSVLNPIYRNVVEGYTQDLKLSESHQTLSTIRSLNEEHPCPFIDSGSGYTPVILDSTMTGETLPDVCTPTQMDVKPFTCSVSGCNTVFTYQHDLRRHVKTKHPDFNSSQGYRCASMGCLSAGKVWMRLDSFRQHVFRRHGNEDADILIQKSANANRRPSSALPFTITTPDSFPKIRSVDRNITPEQALKPYTLSASIDAYQDRDMVMSQLE